MRLLIKFRERNANELGIMRKEILYAFECNDYVCTMTPSHFHGNESFVWTMHSIFHKPVCMQYHCSYMYNTITKEKGLHGSSGWDVVLAPN